MVFAILHLAPPPAISFVPSCLFFLVSSNDVKNKQMLQKLQCCRTYLKDNGGRQFVFSSLQTPENVYEVSYHKTILKKKKKTKHAQENLNFPFYLLDLHLRLFQPTLLSLWTSDLQFQLTSNQVYLSCPIGKSKAVCSK